MNESAIESSKSKKLCFVFIFAIILTYCIPVSCKQSKELSPLFVPVGHVRVSAIYDVKVVPPYAYALERGILRVLDIRDPRSVQEIGTLEFERPRGRMALDFPYLYLYGFAESLGVIDISKPDSPVWVGDCPQIKGTMTDGFRLVDDTAYHVGISSTDSTQSEETVLFEILDLETDPSKPVRISSIDLYLIPTHSEFAYLAYSTGRAYVLVHTKPQVKIIVIDTSNPVEPKIDHTIVLPEGNIYKEIQDRKDLLFLLEADPLSRFLIYQISNPKEPELLGVHLLNAAVPIEIIFRNETAYVSSKAWLPSQTHLSVFDIKNPKEPKLSYSYKIEDNWAAGLGMAIADNRLYLAGDGGPMPIFDLSQPDLPKLVGQCEYGGGWVEDVICRAGKMVVINGGGDYFVFDIQDPSHPLRLVRTQTKEREDNLAITAFDSRVLLAYKNKPAQILDLIPSEQPTIIAQFETNRRPTSAVMTRSHAYLGYGDDDRGGIEVIDLSNEEVAEPAAVLNLPLPVHDMAMKEEKICAAHPNGSLSIVDVSHPKQPKLTCLYESDKLNSADTKSIALDPQVVMSTAGDYAFLLSNDNTKGSNAYIGKDLLEVIDLRDISKAYTLSKLSIDKHDLSASSIGQIGDYVIIYSGEIIVVDVEDPTHPRIKERQTIPAWQFTGNVILTLDNKNLYLGCFEDGVRIYRLPTYLRSVLLNSEDL